MITRRLFLKSVTAASVAIVAPSIVAGAQELYRITPVQGMSEAFWNRYKNRNPKVSIDWIDDPLYRVDIPEQINSTTYEDFTELL